MDFNNDEYQNRQQSENQTDHNTQQETEQNPYYSNQSDTNKGPGLNKPMDHKQAKQKRSKTPKAKSSHPLLSGIIGGVVAAVIVAALFLTNTIPSDIAGNSSDGGGNGDSGQESAPAVSNTAASDDSSIATDINETSEAVVGVVNKQQANPWEDSEDAGMGSGIIYKKEDDKAYVVTNNHVVSEAKEVEVALDDENKKDAKVLGTDELTDLAVLEIDGEDIDTVAKLGESGDLEVGEDVIAIGNPLGVEFSGSVTKGIISGLERNIPIDTSGNNQPDWSTEVIQTDAAINPGNSGGALVNEDGEIIGINSMKIAQQAVEGLGFAIPIDSAEPIMENLEKDGNVERPFIGISTASLDEVPPQYQEKIQLPDDVENGMVIADVESGSPADEAGLEQFDVLTEIDGNEVDSILDLRKYMYDETKIGDEVEMEVYQNGEPENVELELTKREDED